MSRGNLSLSVLLQSLKIPSIQPKRMAEIVVIFDFDKTIIDLDSDNWVVDELGATDLFNQLLPTMPWNSVMVSFQLPT